MCVLDLEPAELWREVPRRARKQHICNACGGTIHPGDAYLDHFSLSDGDAWSESMCFPCWWARRMFADDHGTTMVPSMLEEVLRECIGENDDPEDKWRPVLAGLLWRYHRSPSWLKRIHPAAAAPEADHG